MNDPRVHKINTFREKHERQLLLIAAQAVVCAGCLNDGNAALLDTEMSHFSGQILDLVEQERRAFNRRARAGLPLNNLTDAIALKAIP